MSDEASALPLPWDSARTSLILTRETTQAWPKVRPLFAVGGYFPEGLTIHSAQPLATSADEVTVTGTAVIDAVSFPVEAKFRGSEPHVELDLTVTLTLAKLSGDGSKFRAAAAWQPKVRFRSNGGHCKIELDAISGTLHVAGFELTATLGMSVPRVAIRRKSDHRDFSKLTRFYMTTPGPQLVATLRPEKKPLSAITREYTLGDVGKDLALKEMRLSADPWRGSYSLALDAGGHWEILPGCDLTKVSALLLYASETRTVEAALRAAITLGDIPFEVQAAYDSGLSGWQFNGGIVREKPLEMVGFVNGLLNQLGVTGKKCPQALSGATINELAVSFNTSTKAFFMRCEARLPLRNGKALAMAVLFGIEGDRMRSRGTVTLGTLEFDLQFVDTDRAKMLVASYSDAMPFQLKPRDVLKMILDDKDTRDPKLAGLDKDLSFSVRDALFVYQHHDKDPATWLLAVDVEAGMDFSGLPVVGSSFPPGQGARLLLQPLITSGGMDSSVLADLVHAGGLSLPTPLPKDAGFSVTTRLALGTQELKFGLPVHFSDGKMADAPDIQRTDPPGVTRVDDVSWIPVHRTFNPLALERVGLRYNQGALDLLLDAHLSAGGLTLALQGFGVQLKLTDPGRVTPVLDGIGLDFRSSSIEIGGSLMHQKVGTGADAFDEYVGTVIVKAGSLTIDALGAYRIVDGHPSLFVYAALDYPIGGPSFFFVTGLAAAFGYNRSFKVPPIEKLASFPLLGAQVGKTDTRSAGALRAASDALREYIPAEVGAVFLGVGLKFSSFQTVASSALLTASFGKELAVDLIGRSTLIMPAGVKRENAVAVVEMAWQASYRPADGLLALRAQLSPGSYVFASDCHLAGGFAFYSWFSGPHAGDFVLTAGGYHPAFDLARRPHFPRVPRLSVAWQVSEALSIKGDAYYALTSSAAMMGGHLEMVWEQHPYKAWCKAGIDCLVEWKPIHYEGEAYVELGASYTFDLAGTRHLTLEAGADLKIWGPEFSGLARVDLVLFSFDMSFGTATAKPPPVHLFDDDGKGKGTGFAALLPQASKICAVSVTGGLSRFEEGRKVWVVNPKALRLRVDSVIPSQQVHVEGMSQDLGDQSTGAPSRFGIAPMAKGHDEISSVTTIVLTKVGDPDWKPKHLQYQLRTNRFPSALWGEPKKSAVSGKPADEALIEALAGVEITPKGEMDTGAKLAWQGIELFERHRPALRDGTYDIDVTQRLSVKAGAGAIHGSHCCEPLEAKVALRFEVAGEEFSLPASCIHSVFPPKGSLGDHSTALPQVILERSTLPWERSAEVKGADENTPWLALLVFDGEKKATADESKNGLPGPARITVEAAEIPSPHELKLLCHVRVARGLDGGAGIERAVVLANRAPTIGKLSTVHLVSMRGIDVRGAQRRVVSLWSWSFSCPARGASFAALMEDVAKAPFAGAGVRLGYTQPSGARAEADYRGPLVPMSGAADGRSGSRRESQDRPDISQVAALELGRLLALQDKSVSIGLLRLKRARAHDARHDSQREAAQHLYAPKSPAVATPQSTSGLLLPLELERLLTPELAAWVDGLLKLEGVPLRYLLPDEHLLPKESMRSFELDAQWITNLLVGALGVGGAWRLGAEEKDTLPEFEEALRVGRGPAGPKERPFGTLQALTGVVLRSQLVPGWPAMSVGADGDREPLVCRRLSKNMLLALFKGATRKVVFRLPQESLHFESSAENKPIPANWLRDARTSLQLGQHVRLATQEEVHCALREDA